MSETLTAPQHQIQGWQAIAGSIDHTLLKPEASQEQIVRLCEEAAHYGFAAVCVNPWWIGLAASTLRGTSVKVATTIGFPLGANHTTVKRFEAQEATRLGAQELDMVMNIGALKSGDGPHCRIFTEEENDRLAACSALIQGDSKDLSRFKLELRFREDGLPHAL